ALRGRRRTRLWQRGFRGAGVAASGTHGSANHDPACKSEPAFAQLEHGRGDRLLRGGAAAWVGKNPHPLVAGTGERWRWHRSMLGRVWRYVPRGAPNLRKPGRVAGK